MPIQIIQPASASLTPNDGSVRCSAAELACIAVAIGLLLFAQIATARPGNEFHKGVWLDEYFTLLIANDPSITHALAALRGGMDGMPPLYYCILRAAHRVVGGDPIAVYRGCSCVAMGIALLAIYATLRHTFDRMTAAAALLATWTHPLLARYAIEARPYAMMLAGAACLAWGLRMQGRRGLFIVFLAAAFTCTIHYLGIVPVTGMLLAELLIGVGGWGDRWRRVLPGMIGMAALLPFVPLMRQQFYSIGSTWAEPFRAYTTVMLLSKLYFSLPLMAVLMGWWLSRLLRNTYRSVQAAELRRIAPLAAMLFVPLVLVVRSQFRDSLMIDRYMITVSLGIAALLGLALVETDFRIKLLLLILFIGASGALVRWNAGRLNHLQDYFDQIAQEASGNHYALVFTSRNEAWPIWFEHPELRERIALIDLPAGAVPADSDVACQQRLDKNLSHFCDLPPMWNGQSIAAHGRFRLIGDAALIQGAIPIDQQKDLYEIPPTMRR